MLLVGAWARGPLSCPLGWQCAHCSVFSCQQPCSQAWGAAQESRPARARLPLPPPGPPVLPLQCWLWEAPILCVVIPAVRPENFPRPTCSRSQRVAAAAATAGVGGAGGRVAAS